MILENISQSSVGFVATNIEQYTALQILLDLSDHPSNIRKYWIAAARHSVSELLQAHRRVCQTNGKPDRLFLELAKH